MQNISRKVLVVILGVLTVGVIGVSAYVVYQIQASQAPTSSSASGFGPNATKGLYAEVERVFRLTDCSTIFSKQVVQTYAPKEFTELRALDLTVADGKAEYRNPLNCDVALGESKTMHLSLFTYGLDSMIDSSKEALYARINANLTAILSTGTYFGSDYFFGTDKTDTKVCRGNFFHKQNDFEYLTITYSGFDKCEDTSKLNAAAGYVISEVVNQIMTQVTNNVNTLNTLTTQ